RKGRRNSLQENHDKSIGGTLLRLSRIERGSRAFKYFYAGRNLTRGAPTGKVLNIARSQVRALVGNRRSGRQCLNAFRYPMPVLRLPSATVEEKGRDRSRRQILEMRSPLTRHAAAPADESTRRIEERERKISIRDAVNSHLAG
ncbi:hypothetical protein ALC62_09829, partial [Cyphomyrmex costatus]